VTNALPVIDFVLRKLGERHNLASSTGKAAAANEIGEILATVADPVEQANRVDEAATVLGVEPSAIWLSVRPKLASSKPGTLSRQWRAAAEPALLEGDTLDEYALALLMRARQVFGPIEVPAFDFALSQSRALAERLGREVPEELQPYAQRVQRSLGPIERFTEAQLRQELELTRLRMEKRSLPERERVGAR
jgi:hypothetical protein